jgi:hypothetical protein
MDLLASSLNRQLVGFYLSIGWLIFTTTVSLTLWRVTSCPHAQP